MIEISTDGRRLILEPAAEETRLSVTSGVPSPQSQESQAGEWDYSDPKVTVRLVDSLVRDFHMNNERFRRLHHARNYENTIKAHREYASRRPSRFQSGGTNAATARRLHECLEALQRGLSWDSALEHATRQVPR